MKPREKAKEEAMKLLKSGAISIENKNERHTFKRKPKVSDSIIWIVVTYRKVKKMRCQDPT